MMYDYMGVRKYFRTLNWSYSPDDVYKMTMPAQSSAGLRAGRTENFMYEGVECVVTPLGTKADQEKVAKERIAQYIKEYENTGKINFLETACMIAFKHEIFWSEVDDSVKRQATSEKCREFFIMNIMHYIFSNLMMKDRQLIERGRMIKIGLRWWHGGAQKFAEQMKYKNPKMRYFDGDFKAIDTTIKKILLEIYETQAGIYYKNDLKEKSLYSALMFLVTQNLSVKLVHIFGAVWKVIIGAMPSGAYETSHGDSWIVGLLFFAYLASVIIKHPDRAERIYDALRKGEIEIPVYGDDHTGGVVEDLIDIINENGFAHYVFTVFQMTIKDIRENIPFLSIPDMWGGVTTNGVVFLKRRFIKCPKGYGSDMPDVVPYKCLLDSLVKFGFGNTHRYNYADYAIAAIGMAYDGMGTNHAQYKLSLELYKFSMRMGGFKTQEDLWDEVLANRTKEVQKNITRILRKLDMTIDALRVGFPSQYDLMRKHAIDEKYTDFTWENRRYNASQYNPSDERNYRNDEW